MRRTTARHCDTGDSAAHIGRIVLCRRPITPIARLLAIAVTSQASLDGKLPVASDSRGEIARRYDLKITYTYEAQPVAKMQDSHGNEIGHSTAERT